MQPESAAQTSELHCLEDASAARVEDDDLSLMRASDFRKRVRSSETSNSPLTTTNRCPSVVVPASKLRPAEASVAASVVHTTNTIAVATRSIALPPSRA